MACLDEEMRLFIERAIVILIIYLLLNGEEA